MKTKLILCPCRRIIKRTTMILTRKAKEDFLHWNHHVKDDKHSNSARLGFAELNENLQNTIITEWFDSVGILIKIDPDIYSYTGLSFYASVNDELIDKLYSRHEATKQEIIKANEIYNNKKS